MPTDLPAPAKPPPNLAQLALGLCRIRTSRGLLLAGNTIVTAGVILGERRGAWKYVARPIVEIGVLVSRMGLSLWYPLVPRR